MEHVSYKWEVKGHVGISVVKETAQCGERQGKQAWRYANEKIYGRSTHLVKSNNWNNKTACVKQAKSLHTWTLNT